MGEYPENLQIRQILIQTIDAALFLLKPGRFQPLSAVTVNGQPMACNAASISSSRER